ncbi:MULTISPECIES: hypothetical protein [unclassified Streptomyces]|uniref:hypothetical protein n=1 Tax=unclassified Streptomyces TaxID=2593676 RepID=UPI002E2E0070|nr:hypothetical protein [Streptomyces sp. NBC_01439]
MSVSTVSAAEGGLSVTLPAISDKVSTFRTYHAVAFIEQSGVTISGERQVTGTTLRNGMSLLVPGAFNTANAVYLQVHVSESDSGEVLFQERKRECKVGPAST